MDHKELGTTLTSLHHQNYKLYKKLKGNVDFPKFKLCIDHVQGDPFAAPSKMRIFLDYSVHRIPETCYSNEIRTAALRDYLVRIFYKSSQKFSKPIGTGKGGLISIDRPGQQILRTSACLLHNSQIELRITVGLPANGRRILGYEAAEILCEHLPQLVETLKFEHLNEQELIRHIDCFEDNTFLRQQLEQQNLVAFVANGSKLPRASGIDDRPLQGEAVPFRSPESMEVTLKTIHQGDLKGLGIPKGITLIVGGGYHGKSTLLHAIERGIYGHIPDDGREYVVSCPSAFKVRSEDGRSIQSVPIFPFINNLPQGKSTRDFTSVNASGSTSQASNIMEALEAGTKVLLIDEDTSATNFMIRDHRMQALIASDDEPITPFIDRIVEIKNLGISSILVMGGSGDYFDVADHVIGLKSYKPLNLKQEADQIAQKFPSLRVRDCQKSLDHIPKRNIKPKGLSPHFRNRDIQIKTRKTDEIVYGENSIDLSFVEQLVHESQLRTMAHLINFLFHNLPKEGGILSEWLDRAIRVIQDEGFDSIQEHPDGDLADVRGIDLSCALNRLRSLQAELVQ